ncbi:hypothetical protein BDZ97DRAFT_1923493 [Flammula alnicola]|nr:hypothetical protein BDZ97DRAFT_1923493 [Flammula alnicola]
MCFCNVGRQVEKVLTSSTDADLLEFKREILHLSDELCSHPFFSYENRFNWVVREHFKEFINGHLAQSGRKRKAEDTDINKDDELDASGSDSGSSDMATYATQGTSSPYAEPGPSTPKRSRTRSIVDPPIAHRYTVDSDDVVIVQSSDMILKTKKEYVLIDLTCSPAVEGKLVRLTDSVFVDLCG